MIRKKQIIIFNYPLSMINRSRHRVVSAASPWIASEYSPYRKRQPLDGSVLEQSLSGIFRARGDEPTRRRRVRSDELLIKQYRQHEQPRHSVRNPSQYILQRFHNLSAMRDNKFCTCFSTNSLSCNLSSSQMNAIETRLCGKDSRRVNTILLFFL